MRRRFFTIACTLAVAAMFAAAADSASAQGGGGRGGRGGRGFGGLFGGRGGATHQIQLAALPEVEANLKLTDDQKTKVADLSDEFQEERRAQFQGGGGGGGGGGFGGGLSEEARAARAKMNADFAAKLNEILDEAQQKRIQEIYVQVNGTNLLTDTAFATLLGITEEQTEKLTAALDDQRQAMQDAFQDFQDMTQEERTEKTAELTKARDEALLAVLTAEQKEKFEGMKGEALEIDMTNLRGGFGGRGGGFGGGGGGGGGRRGGGQGGGADDGA
jgi:Spy/CpxP family protein refolding chaperone